MLIIFAPMSRSSVPAGSSEPYTQSPRLAIRVISRRLISASTASSAQVLPWMSAITAICSFIVVLFYRLHELRGRLLRARFGRRAALQVLHFWPLSATDVADSGQNRGLRGRLRLPRAPTA